MIDKELFEAMGYEWTTYEITRRLKNADMDWRGYLLICLPSLKRKFLRTNVCKSEKKSLRKKNNENRIKEVKMLLNKNVSENVALSEFSGSRATWYRCKRKIRNNAQKEKYVKGGEDIGSTNKE
jgi:hypothetical protein